MTLTTDRSTLDGKHAVGGVEWFEQVVHLYQRRAFLAAMSYMRNPEDAREASQEAFARAFKALDRFNPELPFYPWYYRILRNLCLDRIARRKRGPFPSEHVERAASPATALFGRNPETATIGARRQIQVQTAIDTLKVDHREIIYMRHYQDLSYEEMAQALDVPIGTVMSRLYRARRALRRQLEEEP